MTILITGGTGMIGSALTTALLKKGHEVIILTRGSKPLPAASGISIYHWDPSAQTIDSAAIQRADAIVHLAGANVADGRWTAARKKEIVNSRVQSGQLLVKALREVPNHIHTVVSASAIGWYGADSQAGNHRAFMETDRADDGFLGQTCKQWEAAIAPVKVLGKRLVIFRTGIVLSRDGGAFPQLRKPLKWGLSTVLGNGKQMISWIHIDDLTRLFLEAVENKNHNGVFNAVADEPVSNRALMTEIATAKGGFHITVPVPAMALKIALGEMSVEVLKSATVSNEKIKATGFAFLYPHIKKAIHQLTS